MGNVNEQINRIVTAKENIATAITQCGVPTSPDELIDVYAQRISQIPSAVFSNLNVDSVGGPNQYIQSIKLVNGKIEAVPGNLVSTSNSGLVPIITTSNTSVITTQADEWVLTTIKGQEPTWRKLPINAFLNDTSDTTYSLSGALNSNNYNITLTPSSGSATGATIPVMQGVSDSGAGTAGLVPAPAQGDKNKFLSSSGNWSILPGLGITDSETGNAITDIDVSGYQITLKRGLVFSQEGHVHSTSNITSLGDYQIGTDTTTLLTTDSLNKALGKLECKANLGVTAYNWYLSVTEPDTDAYINKWLEIVEFIKNAQDTDADGNTTDILDEFVTRKTPLTITGLKTFECKSGSDDPLQVLVLKNSGWIVNMSTSVDIYNGTCEGVPKLTSRIEDYMNNTGHSGGNLRFSTQLVSTTNPNPNELIERMCIKDNGEITFGTDSNNANLIIRGTGYFSGQVRIDGAAANKPLVVRGIVGLNGSGTVGDLYLQYEANSAIYLGNDGIYSISADGSSYNGTSTYVNVETGTISAYRAIVVHNGNSLGSAGTDTGKPQYNYSTGDVKAYSFTTDGGDFLGNATSSTSAEYLHGKTPLLCAATESDNITIVANDNSAITTNSPNSLSAIRKAIDFKWYNTHWLIGNIRNPSQGSAGFGITYGNTNLRFRVTTDACYVGSDEVIHAGNYLNYPHNRITSLGYIPATTLAGNSVYPSGLSTHGFRPVATDLAQEPKYPFSYGCAITAKSYNGAATGVFLIVGLWNDAQTASDNDFPTGVSVRSRRDNMSAWTTWTHLITSRNFTTYLNGTYLQLSGGTLTGPLTLKAELYSGNYALDLSNSNIINVNSIIMNDLANNAGEGILFKRSNGKHDSIWASEGVMYFSPDGTYGTTTSFSNNYTVYHSGNLNVANFVTLSTAQTITGTKTFNAPIKFGQSDSYGLRTVDNWGLIGEDKNRFYKCYVKYSYSTNGFWEDSDERRKNIIKPVEVNLDDLSKLRKIYYVWKNIKDDQSLQLGMIAQDVQKLYPELINIDKDTGYLSLAYDRLSVIALKGIDKLYDEIKKLKARIEYLELK